MKYNEFIDHLKKQYYDYRCGKHRMLLVKDEFIYTISNRRYVLSKGTTVDDKLIDILMHIDVFLRRMKLNFDSADKVASTIRRLNFTCK